MKTRLITISVLLAALFIGTSCSKDADTASGTPEAVGTKTVTVKFAQTGGVDSRGVDIPQTDVDATRSIIVDYLLAFMDKDEKILKTSRAESTPTAAIITTVPSTVTKVYAVANVRFAGKNILPITDYPLDPLIIGNPLGELKRRITVSAKSQTITVAADIPAGKTSAHKVVMESAVSDVVNNAVTLSLKPIVARMEIAGVTVTGTTNVIVAGIFIGNFYEAYSLGSGNEDLFTVVKNGVKEAPYIENEYPRKQTLTGTNIARQAAYNADFRTTLGATVTPGTGKKWAYQVFPSATEALLPRIIIQLKEVTPDGTGQATLPVMYAVVESYTGKDGAVTEFKAGNVYNISTITIPFDKMVVDPTEKNKAISATVSVQPWILNEITPGL